MTAPARTHAASAACTLPGHFDAGEVEDPSNPYPHPVSLVPLPPLACQRSSKEGDEEGEVDVLAYGGTDGVVYLLPRGSNGGDKPVAVRKFDDPIRALAASPDGLRVSVGFEDGSTKIFAYDDCSPTNNGGNDTDVRDVHHPFVPPRALSTNDNDDGGFLSQADGLSQDETSGVVEFDGPRTNMTIRHLAFDPRSKKGGPYYLAVASESGDMPLVICDATTEDSAKTVYLAERGKDEYDGSGVRSVAYTPLPNSEGPSSMLLATLGMEGRVVTWDVTSTDDATLEFDWEVCHKDYTKAVPKKDLGELGGDAADKACQVLWDMTNKTTGVLYMAGQDDVQYRLCPLRKSQSGKGEALTAAECQDHLKGPPKFAVADAGTGHKDGIVALAVPPAGGAGRLVTGGRDGRLFLWNLALDEAAGTAVEMEVERRANAVGVPPITSVVWCTMDEVRVALADGTIVTVPVNLEAANGTSEADDGVEVSQEVEEDALETQPADEDEAPRKAKKSRLSKGVHDEGDDSDATVSLGGEKDDDDASTKDDAPSEESEAVKPMEEVATPAKNDEAAKSMASQSKGPDASKFIDDEADDGDDDDDIQYDDVTPTKVDEEKEEDEPPAEADKEDDVDEDMFESHHDPVEATDAHPPYAPSATLPLPPLQPAFAPSSTPLGEPRRILCWNHVGVVTLRPAEEASHRLVDIAFHENAGLVGGRRPVTFTDTRGFIAGTLGDEGGMFASDVQDEPESDAEDDEELDFELRGLNAGVAKAAAAAARRNRKSKKKGGGAKGSEVYFRRFETFGRVNDKDWVVALPDGERALGVATGSGFGAVITSRRFLRLFTVGGMQGPVIWIPGEPVTVVGRDRFVAVFYHRSMSPMQDGTQLLGFSLLDGITGATVAAGELAALSPGSSLLWTGFSDKSILTVMDSDGIVSMLNRYPGLPGASNWMPVLDTVGLRKSASDIFWPVEVHGGKLACVPLRGGREHPDAMRRPVTTTLSLRIPMATGLSVKSGSQEELSVRATFALNQSKVLDDYLVSQGDADEEEVEEIFVQRYTTVDKETLKLFNSIAKAGKVERAYDLVTRLHSEKAMDVAMKAADRAGQHKLSDKIEELINRKYPPIDEEEEGFDDNASYDSRRSDEMSRRSYDDEPVVATRQQRMEMLSQRISPEGGGAFTPRNQRRSDDDAEEAEYSTDEESPPRESLKRKFEEAPAPVSRKRINPFAKKRLESPAKSMVKAKAVESPARPTLSRNSTFSAKARRSKRSGKQIV